MSRISFGIFLFLFVVSSWAERLCDPNLETFWLRWGDPIHSIVTSFPSFWGPTKAYCPQASQSLVINHGQPFGPVFNSVLISGPFEGITRRSVTVQFKIEGNLSEVNHIPIMVAARNGNVFERTGAAIFQDRLQIEWVRPDERQTLHNWKPFRLESGKWYTVTARILRTMASRAIVTINIKDRMDRKTVTVSQIFEDEPWLDQATYVMLGNSSHSEHLAVHFTDFSYDSPVTRAVRPPVKYRVPRR